jgi:hypothetical protein
LKVKHEQLTQLYEKTTVVTPCQSCQEHGATIAKLEKTLARLYEQYDTIQMDYQRILAMQQTPTVQLKSGKFLVGLSCTRE